MIALDRSAITAEAILATAKRLGIRLERGAWYSPDRQCGCAAAVAALALRGAKKAPEESFWFGEIIKSGLHREAGRGLMNGFEGLDPDPSASGGAIYAAAYRVGREVARAAGLDVPQPAEATP